MKWIEAQKAGRKAKRFYKSRKHISLLICTFLTGVAIVYFIGIEGWFFGLGFMLLLDIMLLVDYKWWNDRLNRFTEAGIFSEHEGRQVMSEVDKRACGDSDLLQDVAFNPIFDDVNGNVWHD